MKKLDQTNIRIYKRTMFLMLLCFPILANCQNNTKLLYSLDSIANGDTVLIKANLASCGEFGGHNEEIEIVKTKNGILKATLKREYPCETNIYVRKSRFQQQISVQLSQEDIALINRYFIHFKEFRKRGEGTFNAVNIYSITTQNGKNYWFEDWQFIWDYFTPLKNQLYGLNHKSYDRMKNKL